MILLLLSDRYPAPGLLPIHALLATGAVHARLTRKQLRCDCNILVETGNARDAHHFACLIRFGATARSIRICCTRPLFDMNKRGELKGRQGEAPSEIGRSYRRGIQKGLLKIISKMGISTIAGYRGAQLFEIVGLERDVVDLCFPARPRASAAQADEIERISMINRHPRDPNYALPPGGLLHALPEGEYHMYNPDVVGSLQLAVRTGDVRLYKKYADAVNGRVPAALRDLLEVNAVGAPIPLEDVEPAEAILKRFDSAGMSLGALSPEAHEALAIAMNRLGSRATIRARSGEDVRCRAGCRSQAGRLGSFRRREYRQCRVLQIELVNALIARLRYARPGIGLISPPPHHDIYSIEDLAQLIYDLKEVNPTALVSVKLVSHAGVGTIAAGVAKANADLITISGHDGGTGASPLTSIRYAGTPWELGLSETQQTLVRNGLRERVIVQTDGGLKTGLDVIKAALLGADSFGFGTAPLVALGCKYLRICHLNSCATGVATR